MPHVPVHLGQGDAGLGAVLVEEAQVHAGGDGGVEGEVRARAVVGGPQGVGVPRPGLGPGRLGGGLRLGDLHDGLGRCLGLLGRWLRL